MIIIKGKARSDGAPLADYITGKGDNGRVELLETRGLAGRDLCSGFRLAEAEAELSRGRKPFWHAQINPADGVRLTRQQQQMAVAVLERHLGFENLPRAVVLHEKDGREHLHIAWSRFDRLTGKLRRDDFTHKKNVAAAAEIATRLGLEINRNPFTEQTDPDLPRQERRAYSKARESHAEQQQASRAKKTRKERKAELTAIWLTTDSGKALQAALDQADYILARGRRGIVVVDSHGEVHSLSRHIEGVREKEVRSRIAGLEPSSIAAVDDVRAGKRQAARDRSPDTEPRGASSGSRTGFDTRSHPASDEGNKIPAPARPDNAGGSRPVKENGDPSRPMKAAEIIAALTRNHSTFTRQDLARLVDKQTGGGGIESWLMQTGGYEALGDDTKASAERSYARWAEENAALAETFGVSRYVAYVQGKRSERDAKGADVSKVQIESRAKFENLMAEIEGSGDFVRLGRDQAGRERYTSRDMLETELGMQEAGIRLAGRAGHAVPDRLRDAVPGLAALGADQRAALDHVAAAGDLALIVGFAGTGKSRMLGAARDAWEAAGLRVRGAALSGIAAESLQKDAGIESRTLHSLLHQLDTLEERVAALAAIDRQIAAIASSDRKSRAANRELSFLRTKREDLASGIEASRLGNRDVIVIDEAAMVGSRQMARILSAAEQGGAKVVLVGDPEQLQAVDAGAAFRALRDQHGALEIGEVRRQTGAERQRMRDATREFGRAETGAALARYQAAGMVHQSATRDQAKAELVADWSLGRAQSEGMTQIILAYTRADVEELNGLARRAYRAEGRLGTDVALQTSAGKKDFASGDRLYFTRNDTRLSVKNGSLGSVERIEGSRVSVRLDTGRSVSFDTADYGHIAHGYAATVHKSQGVTVDRAHLLASSYMDRHAAYVGMTRHRHRADLYFGAEEFRSFDSLTKRLSRNGSKDTTLDYVARAAESGALPGLAAFAAAFYRRERPESAAPEWTRRAARPVPEPVKPASVTPPRAAPVADAVKKEAEARAKKVELAKRLLRLALLDPKRSRDWENTPD